MEKREDDDDSTSSSKESLEDKPKVVKRVRIIDPRRNTDLEDLRSQLSSVSAIDLDKPHEIPSTTDPKPSTSTAQAKDERNKEIIVEPSARQPTVSILSDDDNLSDYWEAEENSIAEKVEKKVRIIDPKEEMERQRSEQLATMEKIRKQEEVDMALKIVIERATIDSYRSSSAIIKKDETEKKSEDKKILKEKKVTYHKDSIKDENDTEESTGGSAEIMVTTSEGSQKLRFAQGKRVEKIDSDDRDNISQYSNISERRVIFDEQNIGSTSRVFDRESEAMTGRQSLYSKYMDKSATVMKSSRSSFLFDFSQMEVTTGSAADEDTHQDFTHGYREDIRYVIPPMNEHEIYRLEGNAFMEDVNKNSSEASCDDHIALSLAYMSVSWKRDLKEIFRDISNKMQSIGKVYSARMLSRYQDYASMFKYSGGNEGIVASMRFTSHCSDIIKSYVQLAALVEDPEEFTAIIIDLAKRHAKLELTLRDHQSHFRPFIEILGSSSQERMELYSKTYFFVSLVSRAMLLAEQKLHKELQNQETYVPMQSKSAAAKAKLEMSKKQPIWD